MLADTSKAFRYKRIITVDLIVASLPARQPQERAKSAHGSLRTDLIGHLNRLTSIHPCNDIATIMEDP